MSDPRELNAKEVSDILSSATLFRTKSGKLGDHIAAVIKQRDALRMAAGKLAEELQSVTSEAWYVLSGGDDPSDTCPSCGIAGYGELRSRLKLSTTALADYGKVKNEP